MKGCQIELYSYNVRKWYYFLGISKSVSMAIKYDEGRSVIYESGNIKKVKHSKLEKEIISFEIKPIDCKSLMIGRIWLDSCIIGDVVFRNVEDFCNQYLSVVNELKW